MRIDLFHFPTASWRGACLLAFVAGACATRIAPADDAATPSPAVRIAGWDAVQKSVAAHKGKVVVVDIWTTTCGTCRDEFPKFVALRRDFPKEKVACLAIACDYDGIAEKPPEFYRERVTKFLTEQKASGIDHVLLDVAFVDFLEKLELSSTPAVLVYGPDGKLAKRFDNDDAKRAEDEFTMTDVRKLVESLAR